MHAGARRTTAAGSNAGAKAVAYYLASLPRDSRNALERLRKDIRAAAPGAEELIAWGMPAFRQGRLLVGYAAFQDHCSFFPMSGTLVREYADLLRSYITTKGSIHFTKARPLPSTLVRKLVKVRLAENEARQARGRH